MKNLVKFTFCTGTHIRFVKKGGTKSEVYDQEKKAKGTYAINPHQTPSQHMSLSLPKPKIEREIVLMMI